MYNLIKQWYNTEGSPWYHNPSMVEAAVEKGWITQEQGQAIIGQVQEEENEEEKQEEV